MCIHVPIASRQPERHARWSRRAHVIQVGQCVTRTLFSCYYVILAIKDTGRLFNLMNPIRGPAKFLPPVFPLDDKKNRFQIFLKMNIKFEAKNDYKSNDLLVDNIKKSLSPTHSMHNLDKCVCVCVCAVTPEHPRTLDPAGEPQIGSPEFRGCKRHGWEICLNSFWSLSSYSIKVTAQHT